MTLRQEKLVNASMAVDSAIKGIRNRMGGLHPDIVDAWQRDIKALDLASKTVMAVAADPENFGAVMKLRADKPKEFEAIMVLVRIELERKPEDLQVAA